MTAAATLSRPAAQSATDALIAHAEVEAQRLLALADSEGCESAARVLAQDGQRLLELVARARRERA